MNEILIERYEHPNFLGVVTQRGGEQVVAEAKRQHDLEQATALKATAELGKIAAEQARLDARRADIDRKAEEQMRLVYDYNELVRKLNCQRESLRLGRERFATLKAEIDDRTEYLHENCWGCSQEDPYGQGDPTVISRFYGILAGIKLAVADFPDWEAAKVQRVAQMETEAAAFAKLHGINSAQ